MCACVCSGAVRAYGKSPKSVGFEMALDRMMCWLLCCLNLFWMQFLTCLCRSTRDGISILFNTKAELVGNRKQMKDQILIPDLEYADDTATLWMSWKRCN